MTSTSPLSRRGSFPVFTGVRVSRTGRPHSDCPRRGAKSQQLSGPLITKAFQRKKTEPSKDFVGKLPVIVKGHAPGLHTAKSPANPTVQMVKLRTTCEESCGKVQSCAPN